MKFENRRGDFEMLAYIKEIKGGSVSILVQLLNGGEEVFGENFNTSADMEQYCSACGEHVFDKDNLTIRVENFLPNGENSLILVKLKTRCTCQSQRKRYKRVLLSGKNFGTLI